MKVSEPRISIVEVDEQKKRLLVEIANFEPIWVSLSDESKSGVWNEILDSVVEAEKLIQEIS